MNDCLNEYQLYDIELNSLLELKRQVVAIQFFFTREEFEACSAQSFDRKIPYCVMFRSASCGHRIKVEEHNFGCGGALRALGFTQNNEDYLSGKGGYDFGMFCSTDVASIASQSATMVQRKPVGLCLSPLSMCTNEPDVVAFITHPFNAMRVMQGYVYHFGVNEAFRMIGNQALCLEMTAFPYETGNANISMLCSGTRENCKWDESELGIAIPYSKLEATMYGILQTINPLERDNHKKRIEQELQSNGIEYPMMQYGKNYDTGFYTFGTVKR